MTATGYVRGNPVHWDGECWRLGDGQVLGATGVDPPCARCGVVVACGAPDPCVGFVEGLVSACCGHGVHLPYAVAADPTPPRRPTMASDDLLARLDRAGSAKSVGGTDVPALCVEAAAEVRALRPVVDAARAWAHTEELCSCETTERGGQLLDAIAAYEAATADPTPAPETP